MKHLTLLSFSLPLSPVNGRCIMNRIHDYSGPDLRYRAFILIRDRALNSSWDVCNAGEREGGTIIDANDELLDVMKPKLPRIRTQICLFRFRVVARFRYRVRRTRKFTGKAFFFFYDDSHWIISIMRASRKDTSCEFLTRVICIPSFRNWLKTADCFRSLSIFFARDVTNC